MNSPKEHSPKTNTSRELSSLAEEFMRKTNSSIKSNTETSITKSVSPETTSKDAMDIDNDENNNEYQGDLLQKLQTTELLPELYNLLNDLQNGHILAKDFDNNAGSIRLKINKIRQNLQEIIGINESVKFREARIQNLKHSNERKSHFLNKFRQKVESEIDLK